MISEAPVFACRRAAMISAQRHRDHGENSRFMTGDGLASAPCPLYLGGGDSCETKPIRQERRNGQVLCVQRVMVNQTCRRPQQNKANFRRSSFAGACLDGRGGPFAKRSQFPSAGPAREAIMQNEPNLLPWERTGGPSPTPQVGLHCAKQTQFREARPVCGGPVVQTNPIYSRGRASVGQAPPHTSTRLRQTDPIRPGRAATGGEMCETNPIPRSPAGVRGAGCTNKPNFAGLARRRNTQRSTIPSFHHSSPTPLCKTIGKLRGGFPIATYPDWEPEPRLPLPPVAATLGPGLCRRGGRECWRIAGRPADNYNGRRSDYIGLGRIPLVMRYDGEI
jgi:hypothetical protein